MATAQKRLPPFGGEENEDTRESISEARFIVRTSKWQMKKRPTKLFWL